MYFYMFCAKIAKKLDISVNQGILLDTLITVFGIKKIFPHFSRSRSMTLIASFQ